jgi:ABC-type multidrug transport system fused ATPase/permease subunit
MWFKRAISLGLDLRSMLLFVVLSLFTTLSEIFGVSIFLPIFQYIKYDGNIALLLESSKLWLFIINFFNYFNLNISLIILLIFAFFFFLTRQIFTYFRLVLKSKINESLTKNLRLRMFKKYLNANSNYHDKLPIGNLVNSITTEVTSCVLGIMAPLEMIVYGIMALGYLTIMFFLSLKMTFIAFVLLFFVALIPRNWINKTSKVSRSLTYSNTLMSSFLVERLKSPRLVRLSNTEEPEINEFSKLTNNQKLNGIKNAILQAKTEVIMEPFIILISLIFIYLAYNFFNLSLEIIGLYIVIAIRLMPVTKSILTQLQTIKSFVGSMELVENRINEMDEYFEKDEGTFHLKRIEKYIKFENVSFKYEESKNYVLSNLNFKIQSGSFTTIVGPSGSGKSTLIDLIPKIRLPNYGKVIIDELNTEDIKLNSIRELISYTPQSPQIFEGTILDHISYGKRDADLNEIITASKLSESYNFITKLPNGFDTLVGEGGSKLSGGQKQRIDLARAILKNCKILILDEPTSNLDIETERLFYATLKKINQKKKITIILITHRLNYIKDSDKILILKNGKIDGEGSHEELVLNNKWYASISKN